MQLDDLIGEHLLSGVEFGVEERKSDWYDDHANSITFILDGTAYCAIEDPSDGYRSSMADIYEVPVAKVKNTFEPVKVLGCMRTKGSWGRDDVLELRLASTGEVVFEVGTTNTDDYYPSFVGYFDPAKLPANKL